MNAVDEKRTVCVVVIVHVANLLTQLPTLCTLVHHVALMWFYVMLEQLCLLVMPAVVIRQRKPYRRKDGVFLYFEGK